MSDISAKNEISLEKVQQLKTELEEQILFIIQGFESQTKCSIKSIDLQDIRSCYTSTQTRVGHVSVRVEI